MLYDTTWVFVLQENFISMITELKAAFQPHGLMLTAAVSAGKTTIDTAYDVPTMSRYPISLKY